MVDVALQNSYSRSPVVSRQTPRRIVVERLDRMPPGCGEWIA
jgi:hypothetical protein